MKFVSLNFKVCTHGREIEEHAISEPGFGTSLLSKIDCFFWFETKNDLNLSENADWRKRWKCQEVYFLELAFENDRSLTFEPIFCMCKSIDDGAKHKLSN